MRTAIAILVSLAVVAGADARKSPGRLGAPLRGGRVAVAMLKTAAGAEVGRASVREVVGGLRFTIDARGLDAGLHGAHVHMVGRCDAPDFMSAGLHWNPSGAQHGAMNAKGPHQGDLPNLLIGTDGRGTVGVVVPGASFDSVLDADGSAMVIHAKADDLTTDPSGNSGARLACGVFTKG